MKKYILIITCCTALIIACSTKSNDPGFNTWLASRSRPRGYYGQPYLENKNRLWVTEWNLRVMNPTRYGDMYPMQIDYRPDINYGYEVNYLLYNYLVYFQVSNNQKLGGIISQF